MVRNDPRPLAPRLARAHFPSIARAVALATALATAGCAAPSNDDQDAPAAAAEIEEPLSLTVEALDVRHGSLRIEATMLEGSADVSMWLGPSCETAEVGSGIATPSGFTWSLSSEEISRAIECGLVVKAHAIDEDGHRVVRVAPLDVGMQLIADGGESVSLARQEQSGSETKFVFLMPTRAGHLHIGGTVIGAEEEDEDDVAPDGQFIGTFLVSNDDLARSMLHRRHVSVSGDHFLAAITVASQTLDVSEPEPEQPIEVDVPGEPSPNHRRYFRGESESDGEGDYQDDGEGEG